MAWYRKTTPSSYTNTPSSNFTDSSKNWRQYKNIYRKTSGLETASLTAVPGRYTDDTRTWRRIKAIYRYKANGTWQKVFGKFAGQPYPQTAAAIRYSGYDGVDVGDFAMMGPGSESIAQGSTSTTYLWGKDAQDWQNIENLSGRSRTFVYGTTPTRENATAVLNDEGNWDGDKLRNTQSYIEQYDGKYLWYRDRVTLTNGSTGTSYSQTVRIIKQQPVINSISYKDNNTISAGSAKYVTYSVKDDWYRSPDRSTSKLEWHILAGQYDTPSSATLIDTTYLSDSTITSSSGATTLTGEDSTDVPTTFGGSSTTGKWLYVRLICKNSSSNTDVDYMNAPYNDVTDYVVYQITGAVPVGTTGSVTMTRTNTTYEVKVEAGNTGTWSNSPTSYRYQWYRRIQYDGPNYAWTAISGATSSTYDASAYKPTDNSSGYTIIAPVVWASNSNGESNSGYALGGFTGGASYNNSTTLGGITITGPDSIGNKIKYKLPSITTFTVTGGVRKVSVVATFTADDPAATATLSWTGTATGSTSISSSSSSQSISIPTAGTYNFTLTVTNAGDNALSGSTTSSKTSISVSGVSTYNFNFGDYLYVGTNGTIRIDTPSGVQSPASVPSGYTDAGRIFGIFIKDLLQGNSNSTSATGDGFLTYYSNDLYYFLRWDGYVYGSPGVSAYRLTYYVKFRKPTTTGGVTTNYPYMDVYIQNFGASVGTATYDTGYYSDGELYGSAYAGSISAGSYFRIYTNGTNPSSITSFSVPAYAEMKNFGAVTSKNTTSQSFTIVDEGYSSVYTQANQFVTPVLTVGTVTSNATSISIPFTAGSAYDSYDINVRTVSHTGTSVSGYPKESETNNPVTISSLSGATTYYITMTPKNSMGEKGADIQFTKDTTTAPGDITNIVLKSFSDGYLRLFAKTGTNTDSIDYYTYRYNPSIFSVERVPSTGYVNYATSSSTSYYIGQIDVSAKSSNASYGWTSTLLPNNGSTTGSLASSSAVLATGADNPTVTYTSTAGDGKIELSSIALTGAANYYTLDVKTTSQSGTSISGYPKVQQTSATHTISSLTNGTAYYIRITPYYYYTVDTTTDSNSIRYAGSAVDKTTTPVSPPGTFTDLTYKEMYTGGFSAVFYTVSDTTNVTNFDASAERFYPYTTQTAGTINYTASKRGYIAIYFGGFSDYQNTSYKWTGKMTPKKGSTAGTTQYIYSMTSKASGTPADLPGVTLGTASVGNGTFSSTVTLDANASRYSVSLYKGNTLQTGYPQYLQSGNLSFSGLTNGSEYTAYVTPYYVYYLDPDATATDYKTTVMFPGNQKSVTGTPAAPAATYKVCTSYDISNSASPAYYQCYSFRNCVNTGAGGASCTPGSYYCTDYDINNSASPAYYQCYSTSNCVTTGAAGNAC